MIFRMAAPGAAIFICALVSAHAETPYERGRYLVNAVMTCGNCHSPRDANGIVAAKAFSGGLEFDTPGFKVTAANITPDRTSGIGRMSDADLKRLLTTGQRPDGTRLAPVMPTDFYRILAPGDLDGIVAYLRTLNPVNNQVPAPVYKVTLSPHPFPGADKPAEAQDLRGKVKRGFYLATIAHCMECHTPMTRGVPDYDNALGKGGREFKGPWGAVKSANLTSDKQDGLGAWSDAEIKRAITQGLARDGRKLQGPMGFSSYAQLRRSDLDAIVAWLRTLPPK